MRGNFFNKINQAMKDSFHPFVDIFLFLTVVPAIIIVDRILKNFFSGILALGESLPVIKNILHMTLVHNTGIAFGLFKDQGIVFIIIPIIAVVLLVFNIVHYKNNQELNRMYIIGFSLILGGAVGNLIDRIQYGYVIDFIDFRIWPVFNIADSAITIGAIIVAIRCITLSADKK